MLPEFWHQPFRTLWDPGLLVAEAAVLAAYLVVIGPMRGRFRASASVAPGRVVAFVLALLTLYAAQGSPLDVLADTYLFSAHMLQHIVLTLALPPLLLLGTPDWLVAALLGGPRARAMLAWLTRPWVALLLFNAAFSLYHLPALYEAGLENGRLHFLEHAVLVVTALCMWWPVLSPWPALPPLPPVQRLLYLATDGILALPVDVLVAFAGRPLYFTYVGAPRVLGLTALQDQRIGALVMALAMMTAYSIAALSALIRLAGTALEPDPRAA